MQVRDLVGHNLPPSTMRPASPPTSRLTQNQPKNPSSSPDLELANETEPKQPLEVLSFTESFTQDLKPETQEVRLSTSAPAEAPSLLDSPSGPVLLQEDSSSKSLWSSQGNGNGPLTLLEDAPPVVTTGSEGPSLVKLYGLEDPQPTTESAAQKMLAQEETYLTRYPYEDGPKAEKVRGELTERYQDPRNSSAALSQTLERFAQERSIDSQPPPEFDRPLGEVGGAALKSALSPTLEALFANREANHNPEKFALMKEQSDRFIDLLGEAAPKDMTAADAFRLVQGNTVLTAYQDRVASEVCMGDHGVRHLVGHNIRVCEELADKMEAQGAKVTAKDRLIMHQTMLMHDLGYAVDTVREGFQNEGIIGQDKGHNLLAARVLREQSADLDHPLNKLFSSSDLEHIHSCILHHDKDATGNPGVELRMTAHPTEEDRRVNLETMVRTADNTHAFDDKLPELLLKEPKAIKSLRLMQTAAELGDETLFEDLKSDLKKTIEDRDDLAPDDRAALSASVNTVDQAAYRFSVSRIAGQRPTYDIDAEGTITVGVQESPLHRQTAALFGMPAYGQLEKFVADNAGQEIKLNGQSERVEGGPLVVDVQLGTSPNAKPTAFETELSQALSSDQPFTKFALLDAQLSKQQKMNTPESSALDSIKTKRRHLIEAYRRASSS